MTCSGRETFGTILSAGRRQAGSRESAVSELASVNKSRREMFALPTVGACGFGLGLLSFIDDIRSNARVARWRDQSMSSVSK
jgi:hypothetical protein